MSKIQVAMVGGGIGGFIGEIHRMAMRLDDRFDLVAGALSSNPANAIESANAIGLRRAYGTWQELLDEEKETVDCISIVTPNDSHAEIATAALNSGYHVMLDKPMTRTLDEAITLTEVANNSGKVFAMTYTYTGYQMLKEMRTRIANGDIGKVRTLSVNYRQGWLAEPIERAGQKQAAWRTDPQKCGAGALGDIGSHAEQLARFTTGQDITSVRGDVHSLVEGRQVDDHASVQFKMCGGAVGDLVVSQVCTGERNNVSINVYGEQGTLSWTHQEPDALTLLRADGTENRSHCETNRAPSGHPAGFVEAFANLYTDLADKIQGKDVQVIDANEGLASMKFIDAVFRSKESNAWEEL